MNVKEQNDRLNKNKEAIFSPEQTMTRKKNSLLISQYPGADFPININNG